MAENVKLIASDPWLKLRPHWWGKPMHSLRLATINANLKRNPIEPP